MVVREFTCVQNSRAALKHEFLPNIVPWMCSQVFLHVPKGRVMSPIPGTEGKWPQPGSECAEWERKVLGCGPHLSPCQAMLCEGKGVPGG